jgi:molybdopterin synthase catalytic subunit
MSKHIQLLHTTLSSSEADQWLRSKDDGAVVLFVGNIRGHNRGSEVVQIDFEAYDEMALKELHKIADMLIQEFSLSRVWIEHRLGSVMPSETAIIAGVSAAHREKAFQALEQLMHRLKQTVPIWKKEIYTDGHHWVNATP